MANLLHGPIKVAHSSIVFFSSLSRLTAIEKRGTLIFVQERTDESRRKTCWMANKRDIRRISHFEDVVVLSSFRLWKVKKTKQVKYKKTRGQIGRKSSLHQIDWCAVSLTPYTGISVCCFCTGTYDFWLHSTWPALQLLFKFPIQLYEVENDQGKRRAGRCQGCEIESRPPFSWYANISHKTRVTLLRSSATARHVHSKKQVIMWVFGPYGRN